MRLDVRARQRKIGRIDPDLPVMGEFSGFSGERREEDETQLLLKGFDRTRKDRLPVIVVFEHVTDEDAVRFRPVGAKVGDAAGKRRVAAVDAEIFAEAEVREAALSAAPILDLLDVGQECGRYKISGRIPVQLRLLEGQTAIPRIPLPAIVVRIRRRSTAT